MAKGTYTYEYNDEHGNYTIRKFVGTNIAYKIYDTYDGEKDSPEKAMRRSVEERKAQGKDVSFLEKRLKDKPEAKETSEKEDNGEPKLEYETNFHLEAPVNDFEAAQAYLSDDDMTQYIPDELKDVVKDVKWELDDEESGHISFKTTRELTAEESKKMSDWIDGQNSDGLGEGFEQQDFAISYYDPYSGDGPYTYDEYQREIENRFDNLDPSEYSDYLNDEAVEEGMKSYFEEMGKDYTEATDEEFEEARDAVLSNPEDYLDWQDIDTAKNDYMRDNEDLQEDHWFNMSSMKGNKGVGQEQNEFKVSELESKTNDELWIKQEDGSFVANMDAQKKDYEERHKRYDEKIAQLAEDRNKMSNSDWEGQVMAYAQQNADGTYNTTEQIIDDVNAYEETKNRIHGPDSPEIKAANERIDKEFHTAEKNAMYEQDKELSKTINEPGFEDSLVERYKNDPEFREMMDTLTGGPQEGSRLAEVRKELEAQTNATTKTSDIAREFLNPDNEYTDAWLQQQAEENGIEIADLDREIGRQMREGGMSYGQRKRESANSAERAQRIIDNDEWYDVTVDQNGTKATLKDELTGKTIELDPYDSDDVIKSKIKELRPARNVQPIPFENTDDGYYFFEDHPDATDEDFRKAKEEYNKRTGYEEELNNWYKREYGKTVDEIEAERQETYNRQADALKEAFPNSSKEELTNKVYDYHKDDLGRTVDNFVKNNPRWEEGIYDETEAEEMFEKAGSRTWDVVYDRQYEKGHNTSSSIQDRYGLKDKRNEMTVYEYENGEIDQEELTDLLTRGNENKETIDRVISQNKKTTNETMNNSIRETVSNKNARKNFKSDYEYKTAKNEPEWTKANKKSLEENFKKDTGLDPYFKDGREKIIFQDYQTWSYGKHANDTNQRSKGIKTIAKEYYGAGWNNLSANQKQQWIDRNESWLRSAIEKARKK